MKNKCLRLMLEIHWVERTNSTTAFNTFIVLFFVTVDVLNFIFLNTCVSFFAYHHKFNGLDIRLHPES